MEKRILEIDLETMSVHERSVPKKHQSLGGRGLTSTMVWEETDPLCHPLSPDNAIVFAPGLLAGSALSSSNRLSAGAKSPLTGTIKEANSGGVVGYKLARLGVKAIRISGRVDKGPVGIRISRHGVTFEDLSALTRKGTYESAQKLRKRYGTKAGLVLVGPAGEMGLGTACLCVTDPEGEPCRNLGRGGLGAVLGSKGVKAIIADDEGAEVQLGQEARSLIRRFAGALRDHPVTGEKFAKYGTVMTLLNVNGLGGLPTRNFSRGSFEHAEKVGAETLHETIKSRGGRFKHNCMPGCVIQCSNKYVDEDGNPLVGSLDFETVCLLGPNIGLENLDQIARLNRLCNDIGIDTMETGVALGVLAEGGIMEFGDYERAKALIEELQAGTALGRVLGSGAVTCGRVFGVERVPAVKGQGMAAYDPRAIKGMGLTYELSPMGADHTAGNTIVLSVDHLDPEAQLDPVRNLNIETMVMDTLGLCLFTARVSLDKTEFIEEAVNAIAGLKVTFGELKEQAKELLSRERDFNRRAGFSRADDILPRYMLTEPLAPNNTVFDIGEEDQNRFYDWETI
jgi:aldehyde:ferredoxin oxidoreductase